MRKLLLTLILIGNYWTSLCQDNFTNALVSLSSELGFVSTSDFYSNAKKPNEKFVNRFKKCAEFEETKKLSDLDFSKITNVKASELLTTKWEGKWLIEFQEWTFENEDYATNFISILESLNQSYLQFCVNKGGIMWWKTKNKVYFVTSRAYFVTYHYNEIKKVIINGLKK